ncbi:hypothetical protein ATANTOWER_018068 [Ataeniobius toweri]|uniref:Uncharacterized protein n=1 Tax=Ataeniobius toweri TaxID=208326 RepID=A0ABU7AAK8_9TELE|nr:hypothetical protein [Ataeniobius toweri]
MCYELHYLRGLLTQGSRDIWRMLSVTSADHLSRSVKRDMGQINGATLLPFGAICAVFLWESGASSIRTTISVDTSRMECPDNKILTVEYSCVRAGGKNGTCFRCT